MVAVPTPDSTASPQNSGGQSDRDQGLLRCLASTHQRGSAVEGDDDRTEASLNQDLRGPRATQ